MNYKLFQIKHEHTREFGFLDLKRFRHFSSQPGEISLNIYRKTYEGKITGDSFQALETLYRIFNIEHPEDYRGRSMSMSDIVQLDDKYFYCDSIGFSEIFIKNESEVLKHV